MSLSTEFGAIQKATFEINPTVEAILVDPFATEILNTIAKEAPFITDLLDSLLSLIPIDLINSFLSDYDLITKLINDGISLKDYVEFLYKKIPTNVFLPNLLNDLKLQDIDKYFDLIAQSRRSDNLSNMDTEYAKKLLLFLDKLISGFGTTTIEGKHTYTELPFFKSFKSNLFSLPITDSSISEVSTQVVTNKSLVISTNPTGQEFKIGVIPTIDKSNFNSIQDLTLSKDSSNVDPITNTLKNKATTVPSFSDNKNLDVSRVNNSVNLTNHQREIINDVIDCAFVLADIDNTLRNNKLISILYNLSKLDLPTDQQLILKNIVNFLGSMSLYDSCRLLSNYTIQDINNLIKLINSVDIAELNTIISTIFSLTDNNTVVNLNTVGYNNVNNSTFNSYGYLENVKPSVDIIEKYSIDTFTNVLLIGLSLKFPNISIIENSIKYYGIDQVTQLVNLIETYSSIPVIKVLTEIKTFGLDFVTTYISQVNANTLDTYLINNPTVNYDLLVKLTNRFTLNSIIDTVNIRNTFISINVNRILTNINLVPLVNAISNYKVSKWKLTSANLNVFNFNENIIIDNTNQVDIDLFNDTINITNKVITHTKDTVNSIISATGINITETNRTCVFTNELYVVSPLSYTITTLLGNISLINSNDIVLFNDNYLELTTTSDTLKLIKNKDNSIELSDTISTLVIKTLTNLGFTINNTNYKIIRNSGSGNIILTTSNNELRVEINSTEVILYDLIENTNFSSNDYNTIFSYTIIGGNSSINYDLTNYTLDLSIDYGVVITFNLNEITITIGTTILVIDNQSNISLNYLNKITSNLTSESNIITNLINTNVLDIKGLYNWNVVFSSNNFMISNTSSSTIIKNDEFKISLSNSNLLNFKWLSGINVDLTIDILNNSLISLNLYDNLSVNLLNNILKFNILNGIEIILNSTNTIITASDHSRFIIDDNLLITLNLINDTIVNFDVPSNNSRLVTITEPNLNTPIMTDINATKLLLKELSESNDFLSIITNNILSFGIPNSIKLSNIITNIGLQKFITVVKVIQKINLSDIQLTLTLLKVRVPNRLSIITKSLNSISNSIQKIRSQLYLCKTRLLNINYTDEEKVNYIELMLTDINNFISLTNGNLDQLILKNKSFNNGIDQVTNIVVSLIEYYNDLNKEYTVCKISLDFTNMISLLTTYSNKITIIQKDFSKFINLFNTGYYTINDLFTLVNTINKVNLPDIIKVIEDNSLYLPIDKLLVPNNLKNILVIDSLLTIASYGSLENSLEILLNYPGFISNQYKKNTIQLLLENYMLSNQPIQSGTKSEISLDFINSLNTIYENPFILKNYIDHTLLMNATDDSLSLLKENEDTKIMATIHTDLRYTFDTKTKFKVQPLRKKY